MITPILLLAAAAVLGAVLLFRGLHGARRGDTPHCKRCDYDLTGLAGADGRCPECGAEIGAFTVVRGERLRRTRIAVSGGVLLLVAGLLLGIAGTRGAATVDWYRLRPTAWVVDDLAGPRYGKAVGELERRRAAGSLSGSGRTRLIEVALAEQAKPANAMLRADLVDLLGLMAAAGDLSPAQQRRFFDQGVRLDLRARPLVAVGEPAAYRIEHKSRLPWAGGWWTQIDNETVEFDGKTREVGGGASVAGMGGGGASGSVVLTRTPGTHRLTARVRVRLFRGGNNNPDARRLMDERVETRTAEVKVVEQLPPGSMTAIDDPALANRLRAVLRPRELRQAANGTLAAQLETVGTVPVNVAFEVFVRVNGEEHSLGSTTFPAGTTARASQHFQLWRWGGAPPAPVRSVDVILRGSEAVARGTVDMADYWKGEIVFTNVPVAGPPAAPTTGPATLR